MSDYTVYIDEAGDLGIGRGTKWFVLSAVIVDKCKESGIRKTMAAIKTRLNLKEIHMRNITDFYKRALVVRELSGEEFIYMNILVDTSKFDASRIPNPTVAYNYICKYLLQRVSWFLESEGKTADIVLSARGTSRDEDLVQYIVEKLLPYPGNSIKGEWFKKVSAKSAGTWELLQLADVCATTMFWTYEVNGWGFTTPCFSLAMQSHLYRKSGKVDSYGIKFFTSEMKPDVTQVRSTRICAKKERTPGATTT